MTALLLELFSEEIPARMQEDGAAQLEKLVQGGLDAARITGFTNLRTYVTPRRLALACDGLEAAQPGYTTEKKGPKTSAPQAALDGFLTASGLKLEQLDKRGTGKDEHYVATLHQPEQKTLPILKTIIEQALARFVWPKSMRWGSGETRWVRPLHSILCLFGAEIVPVEFAGLTAGNVTRGHRFLAPETITVHTPEEYETALRTAFVEPIFSERRRLIETGAAELAATKGLTVKPDIGLLNEVTGLVEWPKPMLGRIDDRFMDLPPEVLTSEMRTHQKYFALQDANGGLAPYFLFISNINGGDAVVSGNERVLRARLSDGRFFYDQDRKKPLGDWAEGLKHVTFHAKIGTIAEKVERVTALAEKIAMAAHLDPQRTKIAAALCKADLVTGMVGEFPELQGIMGRYYALNSNDPEISDPVVANAIRDHYLPLGPDSRLPEEPVSIAVALADKLDTLNSLFEIGEKPTGSKDPYALRRAALGIVRIIRMLLQSQRHFSLAPFASKDVIQFIGERLKVLLKTEGIPSKVIDNITVVDDGNLALYEVRLSCMWKYLQTAEGSEWLAAHRRGINILLKEEAKDKTRYTGACDAALFTPIEANLFRAIGSIKHVIDDWAGLGVNTMLVDGDLIRMTNELSLLTPKINSFLDDTHINDENKNLRKNRLELLAKLRFEIRKIADFSQIEGG